MVKVISLVFVFLLSFSVEAQYIELYKASEKNAEKLMSLKNYKETIRIYDELLKSSPNNINYKYQKAVAYTKSNIDHAKGLEILKQLKASNSELEKFQENLALAYFKNYHFEEAKKLYQSINDSISKQMVKQCNTSIEIFKNKVPVTFENLGKSVNTEAPEYLPMVVPNESKVYYTTRRNGVVGNLYDFAGYRPADIVSTKHKNNKYSRNRSIGKPNTYGNEETAGKSENGMYMLYHVNSGENFSDLYFSKMGKKTFMPAKEIINDKINSKKEEGGASLSNDGNTLYFHSNRDGGLGGFDIYKVNKLPSGEWGEIQNIGASVNTSGDEKFPQLEKDGTALYFSSNGHPGIGFMDLFESRIDSNGKWLEPKNLGYPINTTNDDWNISFAENHRYAYISALRKEGFGNLDIYRVVFHDMSSEKCAIKGVVMTSDSVIIQESLTLEVIDNLSGDFVGSYLSNTKTGKYLIALPPGDYNLEFIENKSFEAFEKRIVIHDKNDFRKEKKLNIFLKEKPKPIPLPKDTNATDSIIPKITPIESKAK